MRIGTSELILYHLDNMDDNRFSFDRLIMLSTIMGRSKKTLINHISKLGSSGYVEVIKDFDRKWLVLTDNAREKISEIHGNIDGFYLTRERHMIPKDIKLTIILRTLKNIEARTFFLSLVFKRREFDLVSTLKSLGLINKDASALIIFGELDEKGPASDVFSSGFYRYTYWGERSYELFEDDLMSYGGKLIFCETLRHKGEYRNALGMYREIIYRVDISSSIWFMANIGMAHCMKRMGNPHMAIEHLNETAKALDDKLKKAYIKEIEADIRLLIGDAEGSERLFSSSLSTFEHFKNPLLLFLGYNNWGILKYNQKRYDEAETLWKKANRWANETKSDLAKALVNCNLSSIDSMKGNFIEAERKLDRAEEIYKTKGDMEGLSLVEYNRALIFLEKGAIDDSFEHYLLSFRIAYPLPFELERNERIAQFNIRTNRKLIIGVGKEREESE